MLTLLSAYYVLGAVTYIILFNDSSKHYAIYF